MHSMISFGLFWKKGIILGYRIYFLVVIPKPNYPFLFDPWANTWPLIPKNMLKWLETAIVLMEILKGRFIGDSIQQYF